MRSLYAVIDGQVHAASQANQEGVGRASRAAAAGALAAGTDVMLRALLAVDEEG